MSAIATETPAAPEFILRVFQADVVADFPKREIEGLVIPFDTVSRVADPPRFEPYEESVRAGAFRAVTGAPNRVLLDFEHYGAMDDVLGSMGSIAGTLGHARHLEETSSGLYGNFRVLRGSDGDKALELAQEGVLAGFSAAMKPLRSVRTARGVVERVKVHLDRVSLCRVGAYERARVMAVRAENVVVEEEDLLPPLDPMLALRLSRFITLPGQAAE